MDIDKFKEKIDNILNEQVLWEQQFDEMATIARDKKMYIAVNPDEGRNWYNEEYFKVYNASSKTKATKVARIKFREAHYVYHNNLDGKDDWILNSKERKRLIHIMQEPAPGFKNIWQYAICQFNLEAHNENKTLHDYLTLDSSLQYKMEDKDRQKYYLPSDLKMPDYNNLQ